MIFVSFLPPCLLVRHILLAIWPPSYTAVVIIHPFVVHSRPSHLQNASSKLPTRCACALPPPAAERSTAALVVPLRPTILYRLLHLGGALAAERKLLARTSLAVPVWLHYGSVLDHSAVHIPRTQMHKCISWGRDIRRASGPRSSVEYYSTSASPWCRCTVSLPIP
ncbi:hypothetical protein [Cynomolgus macaque cytomegalovirus strain Mauritius]|uniref:Uncharacterized protein n=1 Tax=Cynomolgus macaque cytomegalovirus strain Mauritius TaxID=1690255 RepID=A0A0K1H036_9BETA|nr:hypothetical protein [Cynomolgus macaque cytomegalovirus strain Mauritius]